MNAARLTAMRMTAPAVAVTGALYSIESVHAKESAVDLEGVRHSLVKLVDSNAEKRGDGTSLAGTFIRLAWHCSGTYSTRDETTKKFSGGSNGAKIRYNPEANYGNNAGLDMARSALEPIKKEFPDISYADLYTFAGVVAVEEAGGPKIPFALGRVDDADGSKSDPNDRLPNAHMGSFKNVTEHIRAVFSRMGFTDQEMVALLGAHAMGRCHTQRSGFWGPWTNAETTFSNEYFRLLLEERWSPKTTHKGKPWTGPDQFEDSTGNLMMLQSDMALIADPALKKWVEIYAKDEDRFFKDFAAAFSKLLHLGAPVSPVGKPWYQFW